MLTVFVYSRVKKQSFALMLDTACIGLVAGQILGRWGNFFNREAFGKYTNSLFAMRLPLDAVRIGDVIQQMQDELEMIDGVGYIQVHPTFLYESVWCLLVLAFLFWYRCRQKFQGEIFLVYLAGMDWADSGLKVSGQISF